MNKIKSFIRTSLLGGLLVILPVAIIFGVFTWIFNSITGIIQPITDFVVGRSQIIEILAHFIVLGIILFLCFLLGVAIKTNLGTFLYTFTEKNMLSRIWGYKLVKETVLQFAGEKKSPFSSVALVNIFGNETLVTAFVTDEHEDGGYTVFVPTGPNPTSGNIYHLKKEFVHKVQVPVEETMRSIISCGAGSEKLVKALREK